MWTRVLAVGLAYFVLSLLGDLLGGHGAEWSAVFALVFAAGFVSHLVRPRDLSVPRRWVFVALFVFAALSLSNAIRAAIDAAQTSGIDRVLYSAIAAGFLVCVATFIAITVEVYRQSPSGTEARGVENDGSDTPREA